MQGPGLSTSDLQQAGSRGVRQSVIFYRAEENMHQLYGQITKWPRTRRDQGTPGSEPPHEVIDNISCHRAQLKEKKKNIKRWKNKNMIKNRWQFTETDTPQRESQKKNTMQTCKWAKINKNAPQRDEMWQKSKIHDNQKYTHNEYFFYLTTVSYGRVNDELFHTFFSWIAS